MSAVGECKHSREHLTDIIQSDNNNALLHITEALQTNSYLTKLTICCTNLQHTEQIDYALTKMLQVNKPLTHLDLSWNVNLSDSGAHCIFEGLQHNTTLVSLNLSNTGIYRYNNYTNARSLAKMLQTNKSLTHLDLSHNFISANSCIFESVQCNNTLVNLILWNNSDSGTATSLSEMIRLNSSLTHLDLGCNRFSIYSIFQALHDQHSATLALSSAYFMTDNHMDSDTAISLSKMFRENKLVTHLDLAVCCTLSDSSIFEGLQHNTILWST